MSIRLSELADDDVEEQITPETVFPEIELDEVEQSQVEIEKEVESITPLVSVINQLETLEATVIVAQENGGLTHEKAVFIDLALENLSATFNLPFKRISLESIGEHKSRMDTTTIALEDIKDKIKNISETVLRILGDVLDRIVDFLQKVNNTTLILSERSKFLERLTKNLYGQPKTKQIQNARVAASFSINGLIPTSIETELKSFVVISKNIFTYGKDYIDELTAVVGSLIKDQKSDVGSLLALSKINVPELSQSETDNLPDSIVRKYTPHLFNNRRLSFVNFKSGNFTDEQIIEGISYLGGEIFYNEPQRQPKETIQVFPVPVLVDILTAVQNLLKEIDGYHDQIGKLRNLKEQISKLSRANNTATLSSAKSKALSELIKVLPRLIQQPSKSYSSYLLAFSRDALHYVAAAIETYEKK